MRFLSSKSLTNTQSSFITSCCMASRSCRDLQRRFCSCIEPISESFMRILLKSDRRPVSRNLWTRFETQSVEKWDEEISDDKHAGRRGRKTLSPNSVCSQLLSLNQATTTSFLSKYIFNLVKSSRLPFSRNSQSPKPAAIFEVKQQGALWSDIRCPKLLLNASSRGYRWRMLRPVFITSSAMLDLWLSQITS